MHGYHSHIGCLSGSISRIGIGLNGIATSTSVSLIGNAIRKGDSLSGSVSQIKKILLCNIARLNEELRGCVSLVCSINKDAYLNVSTDILWLTPDMIGEKFDIYSNVAWKID